LHDEFDIDVLARIKIVVIIEIVRCIFNLTSLGTVVNDSSDNNSTFYELILLCCFVIEAQGFITFLAFCIDNQAFEISFKWLLNYILCGIPASKKHHGFLRYDTVDRMLATQWALPDTLRPTLKDSDSGTEFTDNEHNAVWYSQHSLDDVNNNMTLPRGGLLDDSIQATSDDDIQYNQHVTINNNLHSQVISKNVVSNNNGNSGINDAVINQQGSNNNELQVESNYFMFPKIISDEK